MTAPLNLLLIGCGKMGSAMAKAWLDQSIVKSLKIVDPYRNEDLMSDPKSWAVQHYKSLDDLDLKTMDLDCVVLAVKPQMMDDVCETLKDGLAGDILVLSIAAGKTIKSFETYFGSGQPIIRVMPNTPAAIGKGISVMVRNEASKKRHKDMAYALLIATGQIESVEDEKLMDAVTAVSGSGPAYVFLLIEAMTQAGMKAGLSADLSEKLARQTVIGSAHLAEDMADTPAEQLRKNVTSPGGTTQAALNVLMGDDKMVSLMTEAIAAAKQRGKELNKKN